MARLYGISPQVNSFLDMLGMSEGTRQIAGSDDGYNVIVGGELFTDYADHPRKRVWIPRLNEFSTAAGRPQILEHFFDSYKKLLNLPDFSPASQDRIAIQMINECHAMPFIESGDIDTAVFKCSSRWASLPGNDYGQRQNRISVLEGFFTQAGGKLASIGA